MIIPVWFSAKHCVSDRNEFDMNCCIGAMWCQYDNLTLSALEHTHIYLYI